MTSPVPETRNSLILRLPDKTDVEAWEQFVSIYEPLVDRLARAKGFQDADARDVAQEVLVAISRAVERWEPDDQRGRHGSRSTVAYSQGGTTAAAGRTTWPWPFPGRLARGSNVKDSGHEPSVL